MGTDTVVADVSEVAFELQQGGGPPACWPVVYVSYLDTSIERKRDRFSRFDELFPFVSQLLIARDIAYQEECPPSPDSLEICNQARNALLALTEGEDQLRLIRELFPWDKFLEQEDILSKRNPFAGYDIDKLVNVDYFDRLVDLPDPEEEAVLIKSLWGFPATPEYISYWLYLVRVSARPPAQRVAYYKLCEALALFLGSKVQEDGDLMKRIIGQDPSLLEALSESRVCSEEGYTYCPLFFEEGVL